MSEAGMSEGFPQLSLDAQVCFPLTNAARAVTRRYTRLLAGTGLTYPQYLSLLALWAADGPLTVAELGEALRLDPVTLTPVLTRLEAAGHVVRRGEDPRTSYVEVTAAGWAMRERVAHVPEALMDSLGLSVADSFELRNLLETVLANLDDADAARGF